MSEASQPVTVAEFVTAIRELLDENLASLQTQLRTSLEKLRATNAYLEDALAEPADDDDAALYRETIAENKTVIHNQSLKLEVLDAELRARGLLDDPEPGMYL